MANKQLTAKVRINSSQAEQKLRNIARAIDAINRATGKRTNAYAQVNSALNNTVKITAKVQSNTNNVTKSTQKWSSALSAVNNKLNGSSRSIGMIGSKLKGLADTYLGVMGMKAIIGTSDTITSTENKLNYVHGGNTAMTQNAMDKMYVSSQKVRMGYADMMSNVSKSMALAGDAFDNNTDKAIRFQEIMAEAYAVGGASQQEMASSMYQMIQALGSGTLAGDELRSVREGAPLAYKAIEKFAQGIYKCDDSLKDMAADGLITAEIVTAAIMDSGDKMDKAFAETEQTFAQTWEQIKNVAVKSFEPVAKMLRTALNGAIDNGLIDKVTVAFSNIAKGIMIAFTVIKNVIVWIADNWNWLQHIVIGAIIIMITYMLIKAGVATYCAIVELIAWISVNKAMLINLGIIGIIIVAIFGLIYVFYLWKTAAIDTCMAIVIALMIVGTAVLLIGILIGNLPMIIIGVVLILLAVIFMFFEEVCYGAGWLAAWIVNIASAIMNFLCAIMSVIVVAFYNLVTDVVNGAMGIWNVIKAITQNIGIAFSNAWIWAKNTFWEFIADVLEGISKLEPVINGIASLLDKEGVDFGGLASAARSRKSEYKSYVSISDAWSSGWNTMDRLSYSDAWNAGLSTIDYGDANAWASTAGNWGAGVKDSINKWGSKFQNADSKGSLLDNLGKKLGLDSSAFGLPDLNDPNNDVSKLLGDGGGAGSLPKNVSDIADNTGSIADSMELADEDIEYLRKIAEMEWKKEYTTANITVDMTNNNTINGESDLDGIVTKLSDKLYEEMNILANGVYA